MSQRPGPHVIVEADGGSRGNPGPAAYGALVRDAATGEVIAQAGVTLGIATNNVAEYSGLIAGLELAREYAPDASIEVRMDSKLVIEQMAGRWKIKHPDMKPLAMKAQSLAPFGTEWTWVPRLQNSAADALANMALDGKPVPLRPPEAAAAKAARRTPRSHRISRRPCRAGVRQTGAADAADLPAARRDAAHGRQAVLRFRRGRPGPEPDGRGPGAGGRARTCRPIGGVDAVVSSPMRRTRQTAAAVAESLGLEVEVSRRVGGVLVRRLGRVHLRRGAGEVARRS